MTHVRGGVPSRWAAWFVLLCPLPRATTGSTRVHARTDAPYVIPPGWFRTIPLRGGRRSGRQAQYKLHSQGVCDSVRGSSNQVLKRTAAGSGVGLGGGLAAA
jgi:hypothetical protein